MKSIVEKCENVKKYLSCYLKRVNDFNLLKVQNLVNQIKDLIDSEVNRRVSNLEKQGVLNG